MRSAPTLVTAVAAIAIVSCLLVPSATSRAHIWSHARLRPLFALDASLTVRHHQIPIRNQLCTRPSLHPRFGPIDAGRPARQWPQGRPSPSLFVVLPIIVSALLLAVLYRCILARQHKPALAFAAAAGLKVEILIVGRSNHQEKWMEDAYGEYEKRLRPYIGVTTTWMKEDTNLLAHVAQRRGSPVICLDETGEQLSSKAFAAAVYKWLEEGGSRCTFVIGGPDGLPPQLRSRVVGMRHLSLSMMTFTHAFARVALVEQLYRAAAIHHGKKYHRG
jgi:23S rRNA (pseudouridine1915-N3)-methyltransferase